LWASIHIVSASRNRFSDLSVGAISSPSPLPSNLTASVSK
jgi:hypothetical protein